ncbi:MAG: VOC family protein [Deltaproteobacteria bacterium]|nr:VOC family protein [Deltaproteobacteria bacterium]MBN2673895.1 VOC family protein [Deltaproteobacteria bacterium]
MKLSIAHLCIHTRDLEATRKFYCAGLGMKKVFDFTLKGSLYGYYLEMAKGNFIEVFIDDGVAPKVSGPMRHLCLETDDIAGAKARLTDAGIETTDIIKGCDNTYQFWFKDPNGIDIELHQYTAESSQFTGTDCEVDWVE